MADFNICIGTGDYPTGMGFSEKSEFSQLNDEERKEMEEKGFIRDTTGHWYNPKNYIDCLYADW